MTDADDLFSLRNHFWLGNFQLAINEAGILNRLSDELKVERDCFVYRSYVGLGQYNLVIDEVSEDASTPTPLLAVKLLATYMSNPENREHVIFQLKEWQNDPGHGNNTTLQLVAASIYNEEEQFKEALQAIRHGTTLEMLAMTVQIYLRMNRPDLAEKQVKAMQQMDDDSSLTQLACAWVNLSQGGSKFQEAAYLFQELGEKFGASVTLLNGQAVALMHMKNFGEAERLLVEAAGKNSSDANTLINMIVCAQHQNKSAAVINRYSSQLKREHPNHPMVKGLSVVEGAFDRVKQQFGA